MAQKMLFWPQTRAVRNREDSKSVFNSSCIGDSTDGLMFVFLDMAQDAAGTCEYPTIGVPFTREVLFA
jgi:hypothetical protein